MFEKWSLDKVFIFVDARESERERETNSMYKLWNHVTVESKKELIWKVIYSGMEIASGRFPARVSRKPLHRKISILSLNVGNKGVAKIKWRCALSVEVSEACLKKIKKRSWDSAKRNKIMGKRGRRYQNLPFFPRSCKARFWGAIMGTNYLWSTVEVVWNGPEAQWPNSRRLTGSRMVN